MSSLFDLKQSASELPSLNQGMAKLTYEQYTPQRAVTPSNQFSNGEMHIKFSMSGSRWWVPGRSYVRCRLQYGTGVNAGAPVIMANDIAPAMGTMGCLFQNMEFRMGGKTISRIGANVAQVDALENRLLKSKAWLDGAGASLNNWEPSQYKRAQKIAQDGTLLQQDLLDYPGEDRLNQGFDAAAGANSNAIAFTLANATDEVHAIITFTQNGGAALPAANPFAVDDYLIYLGVAYKVYNVINAVSMNVIRPDGRIVVAIGAASNVQWGRIKADVAQRSSIELIWQPPLSIFKIGHALPAGDYELLLNPQPGTTWELLGIESATVPKTVGDGAIQFHINPVDLYLYVATVEGPAVSDLTYFMSLEETRCQRRNITGNGASLTQEPFEVSPSTYALTISFQHQAAGSNSLRSPSKFKMAQSAAYPDQALSLNRMFLQYAGQSKPSPDADPSYTAPADYISSRYVESQLYSMNYFSEGSPESKKDWIARGPYYYFAWPRDGTSEATHVTANYQFAAALVANSGSVLLFDHHKKMILVSISGGKVIDVVEQSG